MAERPFPPLERPFPALGRFGLMSLVLAGLSLASLLLASPTALGQKNGPKKERKRPTQSSAGDRVEVWTRAPGNHSLGIKQKKLKRTFLKLSSFEQQVRTGRDDQVGEARSYRGVPLLAVVEKLGSRRGDTLLLHFKNGMVVPVPRSTEELAKLDAFVARQGKDEEGNWSNRLPPQTKAKQVNLDPRPLVFDGNKIVVTSPALPGLLDETGASFSPWRYVDTLVGIEVVDGTAYRAQFEAPKPKKERIAQLVARGQQVYLASCQYCHSVRDVGATYGWDFLVPLAMHTLKEPKDLFDHVTVEKANAVQRGLMMPTQPQLTKEDVTAVWAWNKMLSKVDELPAYETR